MADWIVTGRSLSGPTQSLATDRPRGNGPLLQRLAAHQSPALSDVTIVEKEEEIAPMTNEISREADEDEDKETVSQKSQSGNTLQVTPEIQNSINSMKGSGQPLPASTRAFFEPRFNRDFSNVRLHTDNRAAETAKSINARAFTIGRNIAFGAGQYSPETSSGKRLLAHELTHTVQQSGAESQLDQASFLPFGSPDSSQPKVQRMSAKGKVKRHSVAPWLTPHPVGTNYEVKTDGGTSLDGWEAYSPYKISLHYWCHGHSLGTFSQYGYSVYSGSPMATVLKDEWNNIPPSKTKAGDIAVWLPQYDHSALFTSPVVAGGNLDPARSKLTTKNGKNSLKTDTLAGIGATYPGRRIAVYRHK